MHLLKFKTRCTPSLNILISICIIHPSMGMIARNEQEKHQLAEEICELWARAITCSNPHHHPPNKLPFINWYLVLRVDGNADMPCIRKQYHKLALQLHPDKNTHSKAETAFKLVSEAYYCLSDPARRSAFDSERKTITRNKIPYINTHAPTHTSAKTQKPHQETSKHIRIQTRMKELRTKLAHEATVMEKCLIASRREPKNACGTKAEIPIFDPSSYQHKGYPHHRTVNCKKLEDLRERFKIETDGCTLPIMSPRPLSIDQGDRLSCPDIIAQETVE